MSDTAFARLKIVLSMFIYGTIGIFVRYIPLPSSVIANARGIIGSLFLLCVLLLRRESFSFSAVRKNLIPLLLSGCFLGFNWILLFEAYRYTTVATATLCYYLAPVILVALSPVLFREKLTGRKILCILAALLGMVFVSGVAGGSLPAPGEARGILFGLMAAVLYASIVTLNKKLTGLSAYERTILQLAISVVVLLPYNLLTVDAAALSFTPFSLLMLLAVGIIHTGLAYLLYFGSMEALPSQTVAILSYIDPVVAVLLSALLLHEPMTPLAGVGAVLVIGSAVISELPEKADNKK